MRNKKAESKALENTITKQKKDLERIEMKEKIMYLAMEIYYALDSNKEIDGYITELVN